MCRIKQKYQEGIIQCNTEMCYIMLALQTGWLLYCMVTPMACDVSLSI